MGRWVTADGVYGADHAVRRWLEDHRLGYVLAVTRAQRLGLGRVEDRLAELTADDWHRLSAGDGAKGPRLYHWAYVPYGSDADPGWEKGLLIRRSLAEPDKLAFYLTHAPDGTALADLVRVAGTRRTIEACFEAAKGEVGLDQYEVRSPRWPADHRPFGDGSAACCGRWTGWHLHVTLAMLAHAYLAALRKVVVGGRAHARPGGRPAPAHRPGATPAALGTRPAPHTRHRGRARLVSLATPPSTTRTTMPLAAPYWH
jgi:SRSO17 transposase